MKGIYQLDDMGANTLQSEFGRSERLFNHSLNRSRYCLVDMQPRVHYQLNEATAEWKDRAVIDDTANEQPEYEHVISYSWFAARSWSHFESSVSFFSLALFFFSLPFFPRHVFMCARAFELCAYCAPRGSTQYSADKDGERERLGEERERIRQRMSWAYTLRNLTCMCCCGGRL